MARDYEKDPIEIDLKGKIYIYGEVDAKKLQERLDLLTSDPFVLEQLLHVLDVNVGSSIELEHSFWYTT